MVQEIDESSVAARVVQRRNGGRRRRRVSASSTLLIRRLTQACVELIEIDRSMCFIEDFVKTIMSEEVERRRVRRRWMKTALELLSLAIPRAGHTTTLVALRAATSYIMRQQNMIAFNMGMTPPHIAEWDEVDEHIMFSSASTEVEGESSNITE